MNILNEIADKTRLRVAEQKKNVSESQMRAAAETLAKDKSNSFAFYKALSGKGIHCICEVKKASPSKGLIAEDFDYVNIAKDYEKGGASAVSVLTEPYWFLGSNEYLKEIRKNISIPILRKDFTVDDYMIYEAKVIGADAVLLICTITENDVLKHRIGLAKSLGLSSLVEAHSEEEIQAAIDAGAEIIGVNNRNLKDFSVDVSLSAKFRKEVPENILFVAESGIKTVQQVRDLESDGVNAVLVGETLMRASDRVKAVRDFCGR
ncbi:MAG: indole-3-glycerol phosphate synthase TrpC [Ruminococcus bromii]|nr:indole-3-glycerol phosphate synthase TrpC [Ruminococcus bromii]MDD6434395.1 indole-3-glycerol phosphate synthase TrpC [Ruminococcus bromii]MDY4084788.1 indole-3-glycerol phosphate synthase TrpC [Ruminococcus bromii]MDY4710444.1 indole-3-glycerol phosphate synthase TrpC [Ruminococcus bromii]